MICRCSTFLRGYCLKVNKCLKNKTMASECLDSKKLIMTTMKTCIKISIGISKVCFVIDPLSYFHLKTQEVIWSSIYIYVHIFAQLRKYFQSKEAALLETQGPNF